MVGTRRRLPVGGPLSGPGRSFLRGRNHRYESAQGVVQRDRIATSHATEGAAALEVHVLGTEVAWVIAMRNVDAEASRHRGGKFMPER